MKRYFLTLMLSLCIGFAQETADEIQLDENQTVEQDMNVTSVLEIKSIYLKKGAVTDEFYVMGFGYKEPEAVTKDIDDSIIKKLKFEKVLAVTDEQKEKGYFIDFDVYKLNFNHEDDALIGTSSFKYALLNPDGNLEVKTGKFDKRLIEEKNEEEKAYIRMVELITDTIINDILRDGKEPEE